MKWTMRVRFVCKLMVAVRQFEEACRVGVHTCECGNSPDVEFAVGTSGTPGFILFCRKCPDTTTVAVGWSASDAIESWNRRRDLVLNAEFVG
jgi:hypothetical protein